MTGSNRDHRRITVLFGREYEWRWEDSRLALAPNIWQFTERGTRGRSIRHWINL
ncbi:hypothetical protein M2271_007248 [Streptomyces sp. LBL]|uniref:hypothetical protein n=1 Tax=Streptomyces sp. LBL TaxID=2940562 RepID=UPI002474F71D|nr:hypothetical protein [Streptomyces sp. LBL]MDH6629412.1 hypothetical protein [Streptomyces sp. LBL]